ncbi:MAG: FKBP-type peptidyl-prolyl cis-trans isomerase [Pseudomonadota bacterium]
MQKNVEVGSRLKMHVKIMLKDKSIAQDTKNDNIPIEMMVGDGSFSKGFEKHLLGLSVGEKNVFMLPPEESFGQPNEANIHYIERDKFSKKNNVEIGSIFMFTQPNGQELPGIVREIQEDRVKVDFNHPLCGQDLIFEVEILDIESPVKH